MSSSSGSALRGEILLGRPAARALAGVSAMGREASGFSLVVSYVV